MSRFRDPVERGFGVRSGLQLLFGDHGPQEVCHTDDDLCGTDIGRHHEPGLRHELVKHGRAAHIPGGGGRFRQADQSR